MVETEEVAHAGKVNYWNPRCLPEFPARWEQAAVWLAPINKGLGVETIKPEIVALLQYLVPGLVAMIVYRRLIASPHPEAFRSTVDALVFTAIVHFIVAIEKLVAITIGHTFSFGEWTSAGEDTLGFVTAVFVGLVAVWITSNDELLYSRLRKLRLTAQGSYPNEWFSTFKREDGKWIVLQLSDGRRLFGWPAEWPSTSDSGHIRMQRVRWLPAEVCEPNPPVPKLSSILVSVTDIRWIEFVAYPDIGDTHVK